MSRAEQHHCRTFEETQIEAAAAHFTQRYFGVSHVTLLALFGRWVVVMAFLKKYGLTWVRINHLAKAAVDEEYGTFAEMIAAQREKDRRRALRRRASRESRENKAAAAAAPLPTATPERAPAPAARPASAPKRTAPSPAAAPAAAEDESEPPAKRARGAAAPAAPAAAAAPGASAERRGSASVNGGVSCESESLRRPVALRLTRGPPDRRAVRLLRAATVAAAHRPRGRQKRGEQQCGESRRADAGWKRAAVVGVRGSGACAGDARRRSAV